MKAIRVRAGHERRRWKGLHLRIAAALAFAIVLGCGSGANGPTASTAVEKELAKKPRVMWLAAHGDDESMAGGFLARACVHDRLACHFFVFNRDAGAECALPDGCKPKITDVRHREMLKAARLYRATLEQYDFFNAPLPVESFPTREKLEQIWLEQGDPVGLVARAVRRFKPDIVVTLDPYRGFTGHPEHQAAARFTLAGVRMAADASAKNPMLAGEMPHRVPLVYHVQNKYWFMKLAGDEHDPKPHSETFDSEQVCEVTREGDERTCREIRDENSRAHLSQDSDMGAIRGVSRYWETVYLRRVDPFGSEAAELVAELAPAVR